VDPDNGQVACSVEGISIWTDFDRRPGRHSNDAEQQNFFPGDKGFAPVAVIPDQLFWGQLTSLATTFPGSKRRSTT